MSRRKEILTEYKERKIKGGVYTITNIVSGKYLIDHVADLKSIQNRFQFALNIGGSFHPKLNKDWQEMGGQAFWLDVREELERPPDQSEAEFMDELLTLEKIWREELDPSKEY
jgi:hypothetical protein